MKKVSASSELVYIAAILILSFAVAMITAAGFGVSMIVAPAYIVSQRLSFLSFGQSEYLVQGVLFVLLCVILRGFRPVYLTSFLTGIIYGAVLDLWRKIIPWFNPEIFPSGSMNIKIRILFFAFGMLLTALAVALFFRTYFYPQVYDFFVKIVSAKYSINRTVFKTAFDGCCLCMACVLTLVFFRRFVGVGIGTIVMTCFNGTIIGFFGKQLDRFFDFKPRFPRFAEKFEI